MDLAADAVETGCRWGRTRKMKYFHPFRLAVACCEFFIFSGSDPQRLTNEQRVPSNDRRFIAAVGAVCVRTLRREQSVDP